MSARRSSARSSARGYAAAELVLAIAATVIVGALAVSAYRTHEARAQIAASIVATAAARQLVAAAFEWKGSPPRNAAAAGIDETTRPILLGPYVEAIDVDNGRIDLRFGRNAAAAVAGKTVSLTPFETADGKIVWICGNERPGVGLNPLGFAGGGDRATQIDSSIEVRYLPSECR